MNWRMTACDKLAARQQKLASLGQNNTTQARVCGEKQHSDAREIWLNRQWSAAALWCLL